MRKLVALIITIVLILGTAISAYGAGYTDVKASNWAYEAVNAMSAKTIVKGYPDGSFKPNNTVTYGEFIKMALIAATGQDVGNASKPDHWAMNYYNKALELKYFTENDIRKEQLNKQITRAHMALIISSILGDVKIEKYDEIQKGISDITYKTKYEYDITKAYAKGILTGYEDKTFKPEKTLSRAESATVIYRLVDESKRELPGEKKTGEKTYKLVNTADYFDPATVYNVKSTNVGDFTAKAELYSNASDWNLKIFKPWNKDWGSSFDSSLGGFIYLVKDGKIVSYCQTGPIWSDDTADAKLLGFRSSTGEKGYNVSYADYIISVSANNGINDLLVRIVPNPFKGK